MATVTTTTALKMLPELWSPGMLMETTWAKVVTREFASPPGGAKKIGQQLHIPKVKRIAATGGGSYTTGNIIYTANLEEEVTVDPVQVHAAVEIQRAVYNRMNTSPESPYRKMIIYGMAEYLDSYGAALAANLATNVKGSALASVDKGLLLDVMQALATSAQREFELGKDAWFIKLHTSQIKNAMNQFDLTASNVRGDGTKPMVTGWLSPTLGAEIVSSGNVYVSGGIAHNLCYLPTAFVEGFNEEPNIIPAQDYELVVRLIGYGEFGQSEAFDEFAADMQTAAA